MKYQILKACAAAMLCAGSAHAQVILSAETASPGGAVHLAPSHLVEIAGTRGIANIQLTDGQTLTNSVQNVAEGKTDIASAPHILPFLMSRGVGPYGALGKEKGAELAGNLRAIYPYTLGVFYLFAYDAKNIGGWDDLKGRKTYNGPPRGGALVNARTILQIVTGLKDGEGYEGMQANWGQATSVISGGEPDAIVLPELFPSGRVVTLSSSGKMTGWSIPKDIYESEAMQKYMNAPGSAPVEMPLAEVQRIMGDNWTYISEDDTFRGMATVGGDLVHKDMDADLVYDLVSAYIETLDALKSKAPFAANASFDIPELGMCGANPVKYHKGAARAWKDAGFNLPDCAVDQ